MAPCPDNYSILGKKLYSLLEKLNELSENIYTLEAVSNASDMEPTELGRYLNGRRIPKLHTLMRLLSVFPQEIANEETCIQIIRCAGYDISYDLRCENEDYRAVVTMENRTAKEVNRHLLYYGKGIIDVLT